MSLTFKDLGLYRPNTKKVACQPNCKKYSKFNKGDKVIFSPICTCEGCKLVEQWYLKRDVVFTVKEIFEKDGWTTIEVEEFPDKFFASSMFLKNKD